LTITLPRLHRQTAYALRPVRGSEVQRSGTGGAISPLNRAGDHWAVEVNVRALETLCGRALLADIVRGVGERVRVPITQPGIDVGPVGSPVVDGDGADGSSLPLTGLTANLIIRKGYFLTVETAAGATAHIVTETVVVGADTKAGVSIWPMLWLEPADGDRVEMVDPYLEGLIIDSGTQGVAGLPAVLTESFVVEEG
jgi:hypothetical protein